jgi:hypothetical protein
MLVFYCEKIVNLGKILYNVHVWHKLIYSEIILSYDK